MVFQHGMAVSLANADENKKDGISMLTGQSSLTRTTGRRWGVNGSRAPFAGQVYFSLSTKMYDLEDNRGAVKKKS